MAASLTIYPARRARRIATTAVRSQQRSRSARRRESKSRLHAEAKSSSRTRIRGRRRRRAPPRGLQAVGDQDQQRLRRPVRCRAASRASSPRRQVAPQKLPDAAPAAAGGAAGRLWRLDKPRPPSPRTTPPPSAAARDLLRSRRCSGSESPSTTPTRLSPRKPPPPPIAEELRAAASAAKAAAAAQPRSEEQLLADNRALAKRLRAAEDLLKCLQGDAAPKSNVCRVRQRPTPENAHEAGARTSTRVYVRQATHRRDELTAPAARRRACSATPPAPRPTPPSWPPASARRNAWRPKSACKSVRRAPPQVGDKSGASTARRPKKRRRGPPTSMHGSLHGRHRPAGSRPRPPSPRATRAGPTECEDEDDMFADGW